MEDALKTLTIISSLLLAGILHAQELPQRGVVSSVPADRWENDFLTGNGQAAAIVFGTAVNR